MIIPTHVNIPIRSMNFPYLGLKVFTNLDMNDWTEHVGRRLLDDGDATLCQIVKLPGISRYINIWFFMVPRIYVAIPGDVNFLANKRNMSSYFASLWWCLYTRLDWTIFVCATLPLSPLCKFMMTIVRSGNRSVCARLAPSAVSTLIVVNAELYCNWFRHKMAVRPLLIVVSSTSQEIFNLFSQYESFGDLPFLASHLGSPR